MVFSLRVVLCVSVLLVTAPIAPSQAQCGLPNEQDVITAGESILQTQISEGGATVEMLVNRIHFTCLVTVALNMYASASVVVNFNSSLAPDVVRIEQYQLMCENGKWELDALSLFDGSNSGNLFALETEDQCSQCIEMTPEVGYNRETNCLCK